MGTRDIGHISHNTIYCSLTPNKKILKEKKNMVSDRSEAKGGGKKPTKTKGIF